MHDRCNHAITVITVIFICIIVSFCSHIDCATKINYDIHVLEDFLLVETRAQ